MTGSEPKPAPTPIVPSTRSPAARWTAPGPTGGWRPARAGLALALSLVLALLVGFLDYYTGVELHFSAIYLLAVGVGAWYGGRTVGLSVACVCALSWYLADIWGEHAYSHPLFLYWNTLMRLVTFSLLGLVLAILRQGLARERSAREAAQAAATARSTFLANMSHEIRTPLNAMLALTDHLAEISSTKEQGEMVRIIQSEGTHLQRLIDDIIDLSAVESSRYSLVPTPFDLAEVADEIVRGLEEQTHKKRLALSLTVVPGTPTYLRGDPHVIRRILLNLVGNALKFTEHGSITVRIGNDPEAHRPGHLLVSVSDSGPGIPPEMSARIFDRFTQADASLTRRHGGSGLGLSLCREMVALMGGRIWVDSTPGQGATFHFTLPLDPIEGIRPTPAATSAGRETPTDLRPLHILLADDHEANRLAVRALLLDTPYTLDVATHGAEAIERFKAGHYDLVLMDIQMPVLDGYAATGAIRAFETANGRPPTPIVALTAHAFGEDVRKSLAAGCTAHLSKPVRKPGLLAAIRDVTRGGPPSAASSPAHDAPVHVRVDAAIRKLVPGYLRDAAGLIATAEQALAGMDLVGVRKVGHVLHGTGGSFGFDDISRIGAALEQHALAGDIDAIRADLEELTRYLKRVEVIPG